MALSCTKGERDWVSPELARVIKLALAVRSRLIPISSMVSGKISGSSSSSNSSKVRPRSGAAP